jgi:hypothetical protein
MAQTAYLRALPSWGDLCRPQIGRGADEDLTEAMVRLRTQPPRVRCQITRWLVAAAIRDPSAWKLIELSWDEIVDIIGDQAAGNRRLATAALTPAELRPVCSRELKGLARPFSQLPCTRATTRARVAKALQIAQRHEPVLVLGDDDMVSAALAEAGFGEVTAVDIDDQVLASVRAEAARLSVRVRLVRHDLNDPLPSVLRTPAPRLVFIDPMYTLAGVGLFLRSALEATARRPGSCIFLSVHLMSLGRSGLAPLEAMLDHAGLVVDEVLRGFNSYAVPPRLQLLLDLANRLLLGGALGREAIPWRFFLSDALVLRQT